MMTVNFMPMDVTTYLHCRRGRSTFRKVRIDIGIRQAIYNALPQSSLEIVDATGHVWSRADVKENRGGIILDYKGPPPVTYDPTVEKLKKKQEKLATLEKKRAEEYEANKINEDASALAKDADKINKDAVNLMGISTDEGTTASETSGRPEKKDTDTMQQVGGERNQDGETLRRSVHVQVPLVGAVDARLVRKEERGPEGSPDGVHSDNDEQNVLDDRHAPRVRLISPTDENTGRD